MSQEQACEALRNAIEAAVDRKMKSPRDFDFLVEAIFEKLHQSVSTSTLKRFWGYMPGYASTRTSTLDVLAKFIDYKDWEEFCASLTVEGEAPTVEGAAPSDCPQSATDTGAQTSSPATDVGEDAPTPIVKKALPYWLAGVILLIIIVVGSVFVLRFSSYGMENSPSHSDLNGTYILRRGQIFDTYGDYLRLFGITTLENYWDQPVPHHEGIIIWGPEYHHPQWHNEGERDSLMPTITEWWEPTDSLDDKEREMLIAERNEHLYFTVKRTNELRITFMKNLTDTGYVFLGIYRTNLTLSDNTHVVWERVADECDLSNLNYLQQLRH